MVSEGERYAAQDALLKKKADARRELEDVIFDLADDDDATQKMRDAADEAEEWLQGSFERLSLEQIQSKTAELRKLAS